MSRADVIEKIVTELFVTLAPAMLDEGISAKMVFTKAKRALIKAAAERSRLATGRVNQAKVAALTGLTRPEVRALLSGEFRVHEKKAIGQDRVSRVLDGWRSDPKYRSRKGKPRPLNLSLDRGGFRELVRDYSGDIPPRVILDQLIERKMVKLSRTHLHLIGPSSKQRKSESRSPRPDVTPYFADSLKEMISR